MLAKQAKTLSKRQITLTTSPRVKEEKQEPLVTSQRIFVFEP